MAKLRYLILSVLLSVLTFFSGIVPVIAYADDSSSGTDLSSAPQIEYSNVLDDLKKDSSFDETKYPVVADNYTLSVITVAESENLQLFVYVYQPSYGSKTLVANSINISVGTHTALSYKNYSLNLLSQEGVFQKYEVFDLEVASDSISCYEVSSIFRRFDPSIDDELDKETGNTIDEVSFFVGKRYLFEYTKGIPSLTVEDIQFIKVTDKYVGFLRLDKNDFPISPNVYGSSYDVHFVAFSKQ